MSAERHPNEPLLDVLVVGSEADAAPLRVLLGGAATTAASSSVADAIARIERSSPDVIVLMINGVEDLDAVSVIGERAGRAALLALLATNEPDWANRAIARGAFDALALPGLRGDLFICALRHARLRKRVEEERRSNANSLRSLFDLNLEAMWVCDPATQKILLANRVAVESYGYSEADFSALTLNELLDSAVPHVDGGCELPAPGKVILQRHRTRDGRRIEVELTVSRVPLWGREHLLVQARDVTDDRRAVRALEASERRFRDLFEHSTGFICIHDLEGILLSVNPAAANALERSAGELLGTPLRDLAPPHLRFLVDQYLQRIRDHGEDAGVMRVRNRRGEDLVWQYRNRVYADPEGAPIVMGYAQDITAMRAVEHAFRLSERRLRTIADTLPLRIAYFDAQQHLVFANEAYRRAYPDASAGVSARHAREVVGERLYAMRKPYIERTLAGERTVFETEEGEGDQARSYEITYIPEFDEKQPVVIGIHSMIRDITAQKREEQRLTRLARIDALSGLLNRVGFYERLENAIARSRDQDSLLAVLYLDIDGFKQVNDTHGHAVGDALIRAFAARLADKVRASDVVGRLGGDEFTVFMERIADADCIRVIATDLVDAMRRPFELHSPELTLSVGASIGIALCRAAPLAAADLVERADAMLYAAKQAGRGTWRLELAEPCAGDSAGSVAGPG